MLTPKYITNAQVSATIANSFSAGYSISATGDASVQMPTTYLNNLSFRLVDSNFIPIKLLNPLYITISTTPVPISANNDISQWKGKMPSDAPTSEQKAKMDAEKKAQDEADAKAKAIEEENTATQQKAFQYLVQYLGPMVEQQKAIVAQQQQAQQLEENKLALLQQPEVLAGLEQLPEEEQPEYLNQMAEQMLQQQQQAQQEQQQDQIAEEGEQTEAPPVVPEVIAFEMWNANNVDTTVP
jgi:hypothetical protein